MRSPYLIKVCSKCGELLVAYSGNFIKQKSGKYGFRADCKKCRYKYQNEWRENNIEYKREFDKKYYEKNKNEINKNRREKYANDSEYKEKTDKRNKQYYKENKEQIAEYNKQYREENKEELKEKKSQYHKNNPHITFNHNNKRRQLKEEQGRGITKEQWLEMMIWFDFKCAYSGEYLGNEENKNIRSIDHIVALNNGGLNEVWNCVPMYRNYNISKHTNDMLDWYKEQPYYSEERLQKIYVWIEYAYEKWGNEIAN